MIAPVPLGPLLRAFFADHLMQQRSVSPQTINAYRDAFRLLLTFLDQHRQRKPDALTLDDLDAPVILAFLDHLEKNRANSVQSRNARLTAIRSFVRFAALRTPESLDLTFRVLAIPRKRAPRRQVHYLTRLEMDAILAGCDRSTHGGRRDHVLLLTLYRRASTVRPPGPRSSDCGHCAALVAGGESCRSPGVQPSLSGGATRRWSRTRSRR